MKVGDFMTSKKLNFIEIRKSSNVYNVVVNGLIKKLIYNFSRFPTDAYIFNIKDYRVVFDKYLNEIIIFSKQEIPLYRIENINPDNLEQLVSLPHIAFIFITLSSFLLLAGVIGQGRSYWQRIPLLILIRES
jgi:hypothetical protein